jgi:hypothetical protein
MTKKKSKKTPVKTNYLKQALAWLDEHILLIFSTLLLAFIPLYPKIPWFDILPGYIVRVRAEDALIAIAGLIWLIQVWRKKVTWKSPLFKLIGTYAGIGFLSILSAIFINHTVPLETLHIGKSALHLFRYVEYFFLFVLMYSAIKTPKQAKVVLWTLIITVLAVAFYGVGQKYWYWPVYSTMNREFSKGMRLYLTEHARVQSTFGGHYDLGAYLVIVLPLLLALAYKSKIKWERRGLHLAHAVGLWLLIVSASRAPFASYGVAAVMVITLVSLKEPTWPKKLMAFFKRSLFFSLLLGVLLVSFGKDINERFVQVIRGYPVIIDTYDYVNAERKKFRDELYWRLGIDGYGPPEGSIAFDNNEDSVLTPTDELPTPNRPTDVYEDIPDEVEESTTSADGVVTITKVQKPRVWSENALKYGLSVAIRLDTLWPNAIKGFMRNPLLGSGYATLNKEGAYHFTEADSTDNNYLRALGETGLLGFVVFFAIIAVVLKKSYKHLLDDNLLKAGLAVGIFTGSIGLMVNALYIDVYAASKVAFTYWALVGLALAVFSMKIPRKKSKKKPTILV